MDRPRKTRLSPGQESRAGKTDESERIPIIGEHLSPHRAVGPPKVGIAGVAVIAGMEVVEDVDHADADGGFRRDLLLHVQVPEQVRRDAGGFVPAGQ